MFLKDDVLDHVRAVTDEPDLSGTKYRLIGPLGRGGMGSVYLVEDTELGREVALKLSDAGAVLEREAKVIAQLEHPGIVPLHDVGTLPDGRRYYVMKRVRGERLDDHAKGREVRDLLHLFIRICEAVAFAHSHGVLHRDLKPQNVMVGEFGEALVMDWGIARGKDGPLEAEGTIMGTRGYMAPEQARGDVGATDQQSDVYSLGAILAFLIAPDPKPPLRSIVEKATQEDRSRRYSSALELAEEIRLFLDAMPVRAHRESMPERISRFLARHQVVVSLLAAYLIVRLLIALAR